VLGLQWNVLHGALPDSWADMRAMRALWVRPGNYQMCGGVPPQATFRFCKDVDGKCELAALMKP
jgi:hypothetical protein